jgi:beta-1,4-mannosyl-glycoprotein beta-1,4-N-acetylglucosaminyltransferase
MSNIKIIDYFLYNGEPIVEFRLDYLNEVVDYFVLIESRYTHSGNKKPFLYSEKNKELFQKYEKKLMIIIIDEFPNRYEYKKLEKVLKFNKDKIDLYEEAWLREKYNRNYAYDIIIDRFKEPFIIMVCDVDEIPNRNKVKHLYSGYDILHDGLKIQMSLLCYGFRWKFENYEWYCPFVITDKKLRNKTFSLDLMRMNGYFEKDNVKYIINGGWHITSYLTPNDIIRKLESFSHVECNKERIKNRNYILKCMLSGRFFESSKNKIEVLIPTTENELPENYKPFQEKMDNLIFLENDDNDNDNDNNNNDNDHDNYFRK